MAGMRRFRARPYGAVRQNVAKSLRRISTGTIKG